MVSLCLHTDSKTESPFWRIMEEQNWESGIEYNGSIQHSVRCDNGVWTKVREESTDSSERKQLLLEELSAGLKDLSA